MDLKIMVMNVVKILILGFVVLFFLNGTSFHNIPEPDLEKTFLEKVKENGIEDGEIILNEVYGNSCTFLLENEKGEKAVATYSKSLYGRRWKEDKFFTSKMGVLDSGEISYDINDKLSIYTATIRFGEQPKVIFGEDKLLVLSVKTFGACVALMAGFAGRMISLRRKK